MVVVSLLCGSERMLRELCNLAGRKLKDVFSRLSTVWSMVLTSTKMSVLRQAPIFRSLLYLSFPRDLAAHLAESIVFTQSRSLISLSNDHGIDLCMTTSNSRWKIVTLVPNQVASLLQFFF